LILSARTLLLTPRVLVDLFSVLAPRPPSSPLFPYTTLFRSESDRAQPCDEGVEVGSTVVGQEDLAGRTRIERQSFADRQGVLRSLPPFDAVDEHAMVLHADVQGHGEATGVGELLQHGPGHQS